MKKLTVSVFATVILALTSPSADGQNNVWSLPPNYYHSTAFPPIQPLPTPALQPDGITPNQLNDPYDGYDGQISNFNHNAMQDANGDLYFFIVDGFVYDFNGHFIGQIISSSGSNNFVKGYTETIIVPVPGSCTQYYIIGEIYNASAHIFNIAEYAILDMSVTSYETGSQGALITNDPPPYNQSAFWGSGFALTNAVPMAPNFQVSNTPEIKISIAVSDLRSDNTRFLYIMGEQDIARYRVTASGITYDNYEFGFISQNAPQSDDQTTRSEMELIKTPTGYRIACSYPSTSASTSTILFVGEIDNNGDITSYSFIGLPQDNTFNRSSIKGIEFSPNGNYVYITHVPNNVNPLPFKIYDVAAQSFIPDNVVTTNNPQLIADIPAFKNSQIELGKDGKLYLANATSLATIGNSDNPNNLIWNSSALTISYNLNNLGFPITPTGSTTYLIYPLPDQIDGMDYTAYYIETSLECCVQFSPFTTGIDMYNNEHTTSGTWDDNLNPYGVGVDIITVKDELIIKNGANITANNLTFKFAPDAKLVVEQGAIFTVNNCTLTVENTCESSPMWNGVDVYGPSNGIQTYTTGTQSITDAGKFIANNSLIEHAYMATHNFKTQSGVLTEESGYRGGVILATNTTFRNNHRGTVFFIFQNKNASNQFIDDQSKFNNCTFITDDLLNKPALTPSVIMAHLFGVQSVNFYGCDFKTTTTDPSIAPHQRGAGILAYNCLLTVSSLTTGISTDRSTFTDMTQGVIAYSSLSSARTTRVRNTDFNNVWRGIYLKSNNLAMVLNNTFDVASDNAWTQGFGLYLDFCNKFKVENNAFNTTHNGYIGTYTKNSQQANNNNEIYKNTFNNFVIGSQAEGDNGAYGDNGGLGLEFRCNTYTNTNAADIYVSSGKIKPTNGNCSTLLSPANNQFSRTTSVGDFWQDASVVGDVTYQYSQPNGYNINPIQFNGIGADNNTFPTVCTNSVFSPGSSCPTHNTKSFVVLKDEYAAAKQQVTTLIAKIDDNNTQGLLTILESQSPGNVKNALMTASPYLSNEVLLAYLTTNVPNGHLQQVLLANSPLSEEVMAEVKLLNLPKGIKTQITNAQTGTSAMQELQIEIAYYKNEVDQIKSDILRYFLFDDAVEERLKEALEFLNQGECTKKQCELTEFYIANKEYAKATQELSALTGNIEDADFVKLFTNIIELEQTADPVQELATNPIKQQPIIEVAEATNRKQETARAEVMLKQSKLRNYQETIEELNIGGSGLRLMNQEETSNLKLQTSNTITVYPNPTSGEVNITHNLSIENGKVTFKVYNMLGVEVLNENLSSTNNEVKINNLKSGVYFYTITQNNQTVKTDKLMVR